MRKMLKALKLNSQQGSGDLSLEENTPVKDTGRRSFIEEERKTAIFIPPWMLWLGVAFLAFINLFFSFKSLAQVRGTREISLKLQEALHSQNLSLLALEELIQRYNNNLQPQLTQVKTDLSDVQSHLGKTTEELSKIAVDQNLSQIMMKDIGVTQKDLLNRYFTLSDKIQNLVISL